MVADLRVMTFNIRYATADDGDHAWPRRRELVVDAIRRFDPDVLGTQEALDSQVAFLAHKLPEYTFVAAGRNDGRSDGETVAVFFKTARLSLRRGGHFWLSETPDQPGSRGWDSRLPRMVTWCEWFERDLPGEPLFLFNTHFDFRGAEARRESAALLYQRIEAVGWQTRVVVTGDFNSTEDEPPYRLLTAASGGFGGLIDAYRAVHPERRDDEGTRHDFDRCQHGARIDWILHTPRLRAISVDIDRTCQGSRFPSDHYPVTAILGTREGKTRGKK